MRVESLELKATKENLIEALKKDSIQRNYFLGRFITLLNAIGTGYSIALDAKWGDGKTFFVRQAKMVFDAFNELYDSELSQEEKAEIISVIGQKGIAKAEIQSHVCVYYDAWINDSDVDPLLSIIYSIAKDTGTDYSKVESSSLFEKGAAVLDAIPFISTDLSELTKAFKANDPLARIKEGKKIAETISGFLNSVIEERGERLLIIIDELDRCRPDFAIRLLERIKHYFDNERVTFLFAINKEQLLHSVCNHYGERFDACRYLDRFFDIVLSLPSPDMESYIRLIGHEGNFIFDEVCKKIRAFYNFSMRETERFYRAARIAAHKPTHTSSGWGFSEENGESFGYMVITPLIIALKMIDPKKCREFVEGNDYQPLLDILPDEEHSYSICRLLLNRSETFGEPSEGKEKVDFCDRLIKTYYAIFKNDWENKYLEIRIGSCEFSYRTRRAILDVASMLSGYAEY